MWFIAVKTGLPKTDKKPSYGPIIKLNRVGKNRKLINVYKFRTMYPYSEYIQKFLYERYGLEVGGKLKNDFRITSWGKVFRKLWIDELPMLLNYLRREIKIVGVRPISQQYFNLYPEELKEKRIKTKPGLVPPFYYDLPKTLNEIIISELKYLDSYFKKPLRTDIKYFFKAFYNIIFRHARSR
ncbi:MAG: sugar transferase [Candidatus Lokiarchaeota archaeon]|nr:sugar transferase [Candidatus Lokiarchaeota archaeon]